MTFACEEFGDGDLNKPPHPGPVLGLATAKWLLESTRSLSSRDEATYITVPLAHLHAHCATLALTNREDAHRSLHIARARLDEVIAERQRSPLTRAAVKQLDTLIDFLDGLTVTREAPSDSDETRLRTQRAVASVEEARRIGDQARAVRDSP